MKIWRFAQTFVLERQAFFQIRDILASSHSRFLIRPFPLLFDAYSDTIESHEGLELCWVFSFFELARQSQNHPRHFPQNLIGSHGDICSPLTGHCF